MRFFNLFRRSNTSDILTQPATSINNSSTLAVDPALFADDQAPSDTSNIQNPAVNSLEKFLDQNFELLGYNDGYLQPDAGFQEIRIRSLGSDFRLAIDRSLDVNRQEVNKFKLHLIQVDGVSDRLCAQVNEKIRQMEINIHELDVQKILSVENDGWLASGIHKYRLGFIRGIELYQQEKLFGGSTGLFTK